MKTNFTNDHNLLLKFGSKGLKYFLLALVGFAITYVISTILGGSYIFTSVLFLAGDWLLRLGILLLCLILTAIILESLR
ncbi:hypothetical protein [Iningainema tapete]|uniref:Uncharacterized protein n=1 Tax=Iningainema tapete BLCC-T55 TaxID=2748662 RepID=A0A8J7BZI8_9CYAN|nr:hypothetical protein [Iningainema tapete]MBD2775983.1 hypothetical protein [Iningainema tapete BLCC-T55]